MSEQAGITIYAKNTHPMNAYIITKQKK